MLISLNVISGSSKLIGRKFTSFLSCRFISTSLFSLRLKTCYLAYTAKKCLAANFDENIIVEGERSIKAAEKILAIVASVRSTGATVVGGINVTEFGQR